MKPAVLVISVLVVGYLLWDWLYVDQCYDAGGVWEWAKFECSYE